jgi:hypothetical protein
MLLTILEYSIVLLILMDFKVFQLKYGLSYSRILHIALRLGPEYIHLIKLNLKFIVFHNNYYKKNGIDGF